MSIFLQVDSLAVANEALLEDQPVEKTLSIWELLTSGGIGGQVIILVLFILLFFALFLYFERLMAINKASKIKLATRIGLIIPKCILFNM